MGTGTGKTKLAIFDCVYHLPDHHNTPTLIVVPKEDDRDYTIPAEIQKWNPDFKPKLICWASLWKEDLSQYGYVILDEAHHLTARHMPVLEAYTGALLCITATAPGDADTYYNLISMAPVVYEFNLEQGVREGISAPYTVSLILIPPDSIRKDIVAGSKKKPFMQTEAGSIEYAAKMVKQMYIKYKSWEHFHVRKYVAMRMATVYNSVTKRQAAKHILQTLFSPQRRILAFFGSEKQLETLLPKHSYHTGNKKTVGKQRFLDFMSEKSNLLGTIRMLDESANVPNLDISIILQATSSRLQSVQRIGRTVRFRPGHTGQVYILALQGTQDQVWVEDSLAGLPDFRVKRHVYESLYDFVNDKSFKWKL